MAMVAGPTAALAGIPAGLQAQGVWAGRRQLFIRFAAEAETATMYTADALASEIKRSTARSAFHSISVSGRDPLANVDYLRAAFEKSAPPIPVMLDTDGQRPEAIESMRKHATMVQVTLEDAALDAMVERAMDTLRAAENAGLQSALVMCPNDQTSDSQLLRIVEQAHGAAGETAIVVHPGPGVAVDRDRRWMVLLERASALHHDVRLALRLPPPTGMR